ncbi:MAG: hypothetical protein RL754_732 [Bacteroidota bacterium]|jgi:4a-hydroxytetrahydrobiopterin dehydratase
MGIEEQHRWLEGENALERSWTFTSFEGAWEFVNTVAELAQEEGHHPNIHWDFQRVTLRLTTHDLGNTITKKDYRLAALIDAITDPS